MRIDQSKIHRNLLGEISFPDCHWFPEVAGKIIEMLLVIPPIQYDSTEEFRRKLIVEYWCHYDSLESMFSRYPNLSRKVVFHDWFMKATNQEHIRRASQWLVEHEIIVFKQAVREKSLDRAESNKVMAKSLEGAE